MVSLLSEDTIHVTFSLEDRALIGKFIDLWLSLKSIESWVQRNWRPLITQNVASYLVGRGYFLFDFKSKVDRDLTFQNVPYFMGSQGLYLNRWMPDFNPKVDIPKSVPV